MAAADTVEEAAVDMVITVEGEDTEAVAAAAAVDTAGAVAAVVVVR